MLRPGPGWPGWGRSVRTPAEALAELERHRPRYVAAIPGARDVGLLEVVGEVVGDAAADVGAPNALGPGDDRRIGTRVPPRTPWPDQRAALSGALLAGPTSPWPAAYARRRVAGHVLDHAGEIEDRSPPDGGVGAVEVG